MLLIGRKRNHRCGTCYLIRRYVKSNNKFMKNHDKNKKLSYLKYWDSNSLHGQVMSKKLLVGDFIQVENRFEFIKVLIKKYNENRGIGYLFYFEVPYSEKLYELHNNLPLLLERMKIRNVEKVFFKIDVQYLEELY